MFFIRMPIFRPDIAKSSTFVDKTCTLIEQSNAGQRDKELRVLPVLLSNPNTQPSTHGTGLTTPSSESSMCFLASDDTAIYVPYST